jgi:TetR/AcrR family transcriptional regulator
MVLYFMIDFYSTNYYISHIMTISQFVNKKWGIKMGIQERKEREKEFRKQQILEAGEKLFIQKGLQNTTMDDIANVCELSKGTLYLYYKNKEELFFTIISRASDIFINLLKKNIGEAKNYDEKLGALGKSYLEFYKGHPHCFKLMNHFDEHNYGTIEGNNSKNTDFYDSYSINMLYKSQEIWQTVVDVIEEGMQNGFLRKDINPHEVAIIFWTTSNGIIEIWDHMKNCHNFKMRDENTEVYKHLIQFSNIDYEKVLLKVWDITSNEIVAKHKPNSKKQK